MKANALISTGLFLLGAVLLLAQLWFTFWSPYIFFKVMLTIGVLLAVSLVIGFVLKESAATRKLNDQGDSE